MKKLAILIILTANICFGQNFFENENFEEPTENNQSSMFAEHTQPPANPDMGVDASPGNPGDEVPIDTAWPFLLLGGMGIGFYFLNAARKKKTA